MSLQAIFSDQHEVGEGAAGINAQCQCELRIHEYD